MPDYRYRNIDEIGAKDVSDSANKLADMLMKRSQMQQQNQQFSAGQDLDRERMAQQQQQFGASQQQARQMPDIQQQAEAKQAQLKSQLGQQEQERNTKATEDLINKFGGPGGSMNAKIGDVSLSHKEENPAKYLFMNTKATSGAAKHSYDMYAKALPDIQKGLQSAQEGLEAVNDPNQINSIGQAKTLLIKNLGMNRYNQQEGNALVQPQYAQIFNELYNKLGNDQNPLTETQRRAINSTFSGALQRVKAQHATAKQTALGSFRTSGYYDPSTEQSLTNNMGGDVDKNIDSTIERFKQVPQNPGYQPGAQTPPQQSAFDKLKGMFGFGGSTQSNPNPAQGSPDETPEQKYMRLKQKYGR